MGYYYNKEWGTWHVKFGVNGESKYFGSFKTEKEAEIFSKMKAEEIMASSLPDDISEYKNIIGYNKYMISKNGRIFSLKGTTAKEIIPTKGSGGYLSVGLRKDGHVSSKLLHRLVYQVFIGEIPNDMVIDHIDRNKFNNKLDNLRLVTLSQNQINSNRTENASGVSNVDGKFRARIGINGRKKHIGYFNTKEEARQAYLKEKNKHHIMPE